MRGRTPQTKQTVQPVPRRILGVAKEEKIAVLESLFFAKITPDRAMEWAQWLWWIMTAIWLVMAFAMKKAKLKETPLERLLHVAPLILVFWMLFNRTDNFPLLDLRLLPNRPAIWWTGLFLTAMGIAISIWARLSLGSNWSGTVTLKDDHELIRRGLYSRIRHPIYTGILVGVLGTAMILGQLRGVLSFLILYATLYFKSKREESFLHQEFGPKFTDHQRHTGMFFPKLN